MREIKTRIKKPSLIAKRREQIMQTAMILFRKKGYHKTTMREICEVSKVNRGSFYDYFESKEDILVYIYKQMMYQEGDFEKSLPKEKISGREDLEPYLRTLLSAAWNRDRHPIQLLYRETISLDKRSRKDVLKIESEYVRIVAENIRKGLGLSVISRELEILANMVVFIDAFFPLRGWNMHHLDQEKILDFVTGMFMGKLKEMRNHQKGKGPESKSQNKKIMRINPTP
jgi:AcrR family transcriptional regulator